MRNAAPLALCAFILLAACGGGDSRAENTADSLEEAADQSTPAAEPILENAADRVREQDEAAPPSDPDSIAQNALERAGEAQAEAVNAQ